MNCFENIIGIKGQCGEITPSSSDLYIQDLPLIDLKVMDAILEEENDAVSYAKEKLNYAVKQVVNELNLQLLPMYRNNSALDQMTIGQYVEYMVPTASKPVYRGIQVRINLSPYLSINLTDIALFSSNFTGTKEIKVFDMITGAQIDSFEITLTAGQVAYIPVNRIYPTNKQRLNIFICYDATDIDTWNTNIYRGAGYCYSCLPLNGYGTQYAILNAGELAIDGPKLQGNISYTNLTGGLSVQYSLSCDRLPWICSMKQSLAWPILHKFGAVICKEILYGSKRVNSLTTINRDKAAALLEDFEMIYKDSLKDVLYNVKFPNDLCFVCNQKVKTRIRIP